MVVVGAGTATAGVTLVGMWLTMRGTLEVLTTVVTLQLPLRLATITKPLVNLDTDSLLLVAEEAGELFELGESGLALGHGALAGCGEWLLGGFPLVGLWFLFLAECSRGEVVTVDGA